MEDVEDASELLLQEKTKNANTTEVSRSRPRTRQGQAATTLTTSTSASSTTTTFPYYYIPRRPKVIKMRDLSEATKERIAKEYFDAYDPWTGVRIAATLGILISLFTLFLIYKSKYNKTRNNIITSKKTSLYLYDEDLECDLEHVGASDDTGSFAYPYRYAERITGRYPFGLDNQDYPLEEVFMKSTVAECIALTVHNKNSKGPKYGTLRITKEPSQSLPCSPYKKNAMAPCVREETVYTAAKIPFSSTPPDCSSSLSGSITSFGSSDYNDRLLKTNVPLNNREELLTGPHQAQIESSGRNDVFIENEGSGFSKRPQDYRSRSTIVTIGRRKRKS